MADYLDRNDYLPRLYIDGRRIFKAIREIKIRREESNAALLTCVINPDPGVQDFTTYQGKSVILDIQTSSGLTRIFSGKVDLDEYDIINEFIRLRCTDDRKGLVEANAAFISNVGYFSTEVFGEPENKSRELESRLSTIPFGLDFDAYSNLHLTSWTPKATADYTLTNSDVYRKEPTIQRTQRARLLNQVDIDLTYTYQRLHHREKNYSWANNVSICDFLIFGHSLVQREMVREAARAAGWPLKGNISFTDVYPSGYYRCTDPFSATSVNIGWSGPGGGLDGTGVPYNPQGVGVVDGNPTNLNQYDRAGNIVTQTAANQTVNAANLLCIGADWTATTRFSQNMREKYTLQVKAPQSISEYGTVAKKEVFTLNAEFDSGAWEDYTEYTPQTEGINLDNPAGIPTADYIIDKDVNRGSFNNVSETLLNRGKTSILKTHRENRVKFQRSLWPEIDLRHTVQVSTDKISAKGKVFAIDHYIDISTGEAYSMVEIAFYTSSGSASNDPIAPPTKPTFIPVASDKNVSLGARYGEDPSQPQAAGWNGHIGNRWVRTRQSLFRTQYPEFFVVDTPAIDDESRNTKDLSASQNYDVVIPNSTLVITYTGKKG